MSGAVYDVAVDLRRASLSFGRWYGTHLTAENRRMVWIPPGFAHGFWLPLKRLEADRFAWPCVDEAVIELTIEQLHWLLDGIDLDAMRTHRARTRSIMRIRGRGG